MLWPRNLAKFGEMRKSAILFTILRAIIPSPISNRIEEGQPKAYPRSSTSCLQGLRGLAALVVFHCHLLRNFSNFVDYGYGVDRTSSLGLSNRWLHQLPFLRLAYSGGAMVEIFFLVSGYTQSLKALNLMQKSRSRSNHKLLALTIFRRLFRLVIPTFMAGLLIAIAIWLGLYDWGDMYRKTWFEGKGLELQRESSLRLEFWAFWQSFVGLIRLWDWTEYVPAFNPHMWTIAVELRCSVVLQITLYILALLHPASRLLVLILMIVSCHFLGRWELVCFLNGLLLAFINQARRHSVEPDIEKNSTTPYRHQKSLGIAAQPALALGSRFCFVVSFALGLYLLSFPKIDGVFAPGYRTIGYFSPISWDPHRFWNMWGAFFTVFTLTKAPFLARIFDIDALQYLGKISYSMYLVHGPVLHIVAHVFIPMTWLVTGRGSIYTQVLGFELATCVIVVPVVFGAADLFHRVIDVPCGNLCFRIRKSMPWFD